MHFFVSQETDLHRQPNTQQFFCSDFLLLRYRKPEHLPVASLRNVALEISLVKACNGHFLRHFSICVFCLLLTHKSRILFNFLSFFSDNMKTDTSDSDK